MNAPAITSLAAIELRNIAKSFGNVRALSNASFSCLPGEVHALMGENGAGKSTLMRVVAGIWQPTSGEILLDGRSVEVSGPHHARELGIAMVHQDTKLVPDLDVARNIWLGREPSSAFGLDLARMRRDAVALIERLGVTIDVSRLVSEISVAERQAVEIARALTANPSVLILDEPTSALDTREIAELFSIVRRLKASGTAIIFISHRLPEVFEIADRITVLKDGATVGTVERSAIDHDGLVAMMVGRAVELAYPPRAKDFGSARLVVEELGCEQFHDVSFTVRAGEILGFGGIQGNGQSDVPRALFGLMRASGRVTLDGLQLTCSSPRAAIRQGVVYVPGDRHAEGLFMSHSIRQNIALPHVADWTRMGLVSGAREATAADTAMKRFAVKANHAEQGVATLSGGNQQKVVLGRWTTGTPRLFIFEDPTRGVDVGTKLEIYRQIRALAAEGAAVILVSSDLLELIGVSDRILVFSKGRIVDEMDARNATEERIVGGAAGARDMEATAVSVVAKRQTRGTLGRFASRNIGAVLLGVLILAMVAVASNMSDFFLTSRNMANVGMQIAPLALVALGQFVVVLVRGIDLSVGPLISLVTSLVSYVAVSETGTETATAIAIALAVGIGVGAVNAGLAVWLRIPDLIATLSTFSIVYGLTLIVRPSPGGLLSEHFIDFFSGSELGIPTTVYGVLVATVIAELALQRSRIGQRLYATGSAPEAGEVVGVNTRLVRSLAYVFCGVMAAVAGLLVAARIGSGDPQAGSSFTLASVTAVVVGGASVFGGRGTATATLLGAVAVGLMQNALNLMHISAYYQYIWTGLLTLVAVSAYSFRFKRQEGEA